MPQYPRAVCLLSVALGLGRAQTVTFSENVAPIIYGNCSKCHHPGEVAPFSLLSYDDVRSHAQTIVTVTQSHYMPPWKPEPGWAKYRDERRLTPEQISLIQQWVTGGMPLGDPSKAPPAPQYTDGWQLGTPDLILEMPASFPVPADGPDIYRNFVIPTNLTEDKWVRAMGTQVQVRNGSLASDSVALPVFPVDLSGTGPAAVLNQDGVTVNSAKTPAARGSFVSIYATGEGQTSPNGVDGKIATGSALPKPLGQVQAWVDGKPAEVQYAGAAPGAVAGLLQVSVRIPLDAAAGDVPIEIHVGTASSQPGMTVSVK